MKKVARCPACGTYHILREDKSFKLALPVMAAITIVFLLLIEIFNTEYKNDALLISATILSAIFLVISVIDYKQTNFMENACMDCGYKWD